MTTSPPEPWTKFNRPGGKPAARRISQKIVAVIGLHPNTFQPHGGTKTSVLVLQKYTASEQKAVERVRQLGTEYACVEAELDTLLAAWADAV